MASSRTPQSGASSAHRRGEAWLCSPGLQSDVVVEVEEMSFHLHKFPLVSRSRRLARLVEEASKEDEDTCLVRLESFPGGTWAFELAAKFCYGVKVEFTPGNIVALRCAAESLEMTEDLGVENLIERAEEFLHHVVLQSWSDSIAALQSCSASLPMAEDLNLVDRLVDSVCSKATLNDSTSTRDHHHHPHHHHHHRSLQSPGGSLLWNGISTGARARASLSSDGEDNWWYEDIALLSLPYFEKVILGMERAGVRGESIWGAVAHYAKKALPGLHRRQSAHTTHRKPSSSIQTTHTPILQETEQKVLLETIESLLPPIKVPNSTRLLFGLLRLAMILNASPQCKASLEKRIGVQLEQATLDELLVPNYSHVEETLYDIDLVQRILDHYLLLEQTVPPESDEEGGLLLGSPSLCPIMMVAKLLDAYLAETAPDVNLKPSKFQVLAESLPHYARLVDDGLYRAIDVYLKAHPWLSESERETVCKIMSCQKLSLEACTHAAQNERLPLRVVVQVLFFEQLQLRNAIAGSFLVADTVGQSGRQQQAPIPPPVSHERWDVANGQALKDDVGKILARVSQLEIECGSMRQEIESLHRSKKPFTGSLSKALGCKKFSSVIPSTGEIGTTKGQSRNVAHLSVDEQVQ